MYDDDWDEHYVSDTEIDLGNYIALAHQLDIAAEEASKHPLGLELKEADPGAADLLRSLASVLSVWVDADGGHPDPVRLPGDDAEVDPVAMWGDAIQRLAPAKDAARKVMAKMETGDVPRSWEVLEYAGLLDMVESEVRVTSKDWS